MSQLRLRTRTASSRLNTVRDLYALSNDEYFLLNYWHHSVFGRRPETHSGDLTDADWPPFEKLIRGLDTAVAVLNYLLMAPEEDEQELVCRIHDWAWSEHRRAATATSYVLTQLADDLLDVLCGFGEEDGRALNPTQTSLKPLNELVRYERLPVPSGAPGRFDVFISYKHKLYAPLATDLVRELRARGLACWFDAEQLDTLALAADYSESVRGWLRDALRQSQCAVFFAAVLEATVDQNAQGQHLAFNWQAFERRHARALLYVYPDGSGSSGRIYPEGMAAAPDTWGSVSELALLILEKVARGVPAEPEPEDPELVTATARLLDYGKSYDAALECVTPLAALALLAPAGSTQGHVPSGPFDEDFLLSLLRSHAETALRVGQAGLDLGGLFEAGARQPFGRWSAPHRFRWADAFGHGAHGLPYQQDLPAIVTEHALLKGLTAGVIARASTGFVARSIRNRHPDWTAERVEQELRAVADRITAGADPCRHGAHAWLVTAQDGHRTARPLSRAGVHATDVPGLPARVSAYTSLPDALFADRCSAAVAAALDSGDPSELAAVYRHHPEIALTMTGAVWPATVWTMRTPDGDLVVLAALEAAPACSARPGPTLDPQSLLRGLDVPADVPSSYLQVPLLGLAGPLPAHLVADPCARAPAVDRGRPLDTLGLIAGVLVPLERYLSKRADSYEG